MVDAVSAAQGVVSTQLANVQNAAPQPEPAPETPPPAPPPPPPADSGRGSSVDTQA